MKLAESFFVLLIVCAAFAEDISSTERSEEGRSLQDQNNQDWKADWLLQETEDVPRRRRVRKRKRRPPLEDQVVEETTTLRRRIRPQRLDQIREPWEDMTDEITQRSYNRRRLTPIYQETEEVTEAKVKSFEKIRDPFTALQEAEEKQRKKFEETTSATSVTSDLRTLLKQNGGMSLSEVLQQKNLTLEELLKGNQQAISALVSRSEITTETVTSTEKNKRRRIPPTFTLKKDDDRESEKNEEDRLTSHEIMEAQRRRLSLLHSHKDTKLFSDVTKYDVVTEETTEKRMFVPSNSKLYTSVDYRPLITFKEITTTPMTTTTKQATISFRPLSRDLPVTSAKLKKFVAKTNPEISIPQKAVTIDINEIFGFGVFDRRNATEAPDGPFKMSIDLEEVTTAETPKEEENLVQSKVIPTATSAGEKLKHVTAKEEIMEILKNPTEREKLAKILEMRNMTVEELVAQRERGSSQLHLADIFHNETREPEPKGEPFIGHINSINYKNFSPFNRKPKSRTMPLIGGEAMVPTEATLAEKEIITNKPYTITSFPTYKIETNKNFKPQPFLPVWQQLYPSLFTDVFETKTSSTTEKIKYDLDSIDDIENTLAETANSRVNVGLRQNVFNDNEFIMLPSGVKSAIFASLAVIGLSLLVFLSILIVFKWTQRQKSRLNYTGSFSGSKIKSPILEPDQRRTFKTFMSETLGKKRNYYKAHLQKMSDSFWDTESEKKSYMM